MKSNDNLINLIRTLDSSEKGYFRKYSTRHTIGEKNIYLRLFDLIDREEISDQRELRQKLSDYSAISNFSVLKKYLYEMILKSMRAYETDKTPDSKISSLMDNSDYLRKKNLDTQSGQELRKAKNLAYALEKHDKVYEILKREIIMNKRKNPVDIKGLERLYRELEINIVRIKNTSDYRKLNDIAFATLHKDGTNLKVLNRKFRVILANKLMKDPEKALTYDAKLSYYQIHSAYHYANNEFDKALMMYENILKVMESNVKLLSEYSKGYIIILNNCMDVCDRLGRIDLSTSFQKKAEEYLQDTKNNVNPESKYFLMTGISISKIIDKIISGSYDRTDPEVKKIADDFEKNIQMVPLTNRITLMFQLSIYYLGCEDLATALKWNNRIINGDESLRNDLIVESRMLFLIIHLEMNNFDLLNYAVAATERYFKKKKPLIGIEPYFLNFIKRISNIKDPSNIKALYKELRETLKKKKELLEEYAFDYLSWAESKARNRPFPEIKKEKFLNGEIR